MNDSTKPPPQLAKKLTLHKETIRVLTDQELMQVEGGGTQGCGQFTHNCTCGFGQAFCTSSPG